MLLGVSIAQHSSAVLVYYFHTNTVAQPHTTGDWSEENILDLSLQQRETKGMCCGHYYQVDLLLRFQLFLPI